MAVPLRIVVVDDSNLLRTALADALDEGGLLKVVGTAADGREAIDVVARLRPDLVTMDLRMPVMDGLEAVERIMARTPTRIVLLTGDPRGRDGEVVFEALARGALEVIAKRTLIEGTPEARQLRDRILLLASVPLRPRLDRTARPVAGARGGAGDPVGVVGVVASTGGPALLEDILAGLRADFPAALLVVQHIAEGFAPKLAAWLARVSPLDVSVARHGDRLRRGSVLLAPDGAHLTVDAGTGVKVDTQGPFHDGHKPSGTLLLRSIARHYGRHGGGLVLTGMGRDGVDGLLEVKAAGGWTAAQDQASAVVDGMPRAAREAGAALEVLSPAEMPAALGRIASRWS